MISCRQCGAYVHPDSPACWNCRCPSSINGPAPLTPQVLHRIGLGSTALARRPGWWAMPDYQIDILGRAHVGLRCALREVYPTQALMDFCYEQLRKHGIAPAPVT